MCCTLSDDKHSNDNMFLSISSLNIYLVYVFRGKTRRNIYSDHRIGYTKGAQSAPWAITIQCPITRKIGTKLYVTHIPETHFPGTFLEFSAPLADTTKSAALERSRRLISMCTRIISLAVLHLPFPRRRGISMKDHSRGSEVSCPSSVLYGILLYDTPFL